MRAKLQSRIRWMQELSRRENLKLKLDIKKHVFSRFVWVWHPPNTSNQVLESLKLTIRTCPTGLKRKILHVMFLQ